MAESSEASKAPHWTAAAAANGGTFSFSSASSSTTTSSSATPTSPLVRAAPHANNNNNNFNERSALFHGVDQSEWPVGVPSVGRGSSSQSVLDVQRHSTRVLQKKIFSNSFEPKRTRTWKKSGSIFVETSLQRCHFVAAGRCLKVRRR